MADAIGAFTPEQARLIWQDYQRRQQLQPQLAQNLPQRRDVSEVSPHRVYVKNTTSETIPAFACLEIDGVETVGGRTVVNVQKPTGTDGKYLFNGPYEISPASATAPGVGWAYRDGVVIALGDEPSSSGDMYQPTAGSWEIEAGGTLFEVWGRYFISDRTLIGRLHTGGSGTSSTCLCCSNIAGGDISHPDLPSGANITSSQWTMKTLCGETLGGITVESSDGKGTVTWTPSSNPILEYASSDDNFDETITTGLSAQTWAGTDVTGSTTFTATLEMDWSTTPCRVRLTLDGVLP